MILMRSENDKSRKKENYVIKKKSERGHHQTSGDERKKIK